MNDTQGRVDQETRALLQALLGAGDGIEKRLETALEHHGLSLPKMQLLHTLALAGEPLPMGMLSRRLGCVKSNMTQLTDRLEVDGLVRRVPDPRDRRGVQAEITWEGRQRYEAGNRALVEAEREILARLSARERRQLSVLLDRIEG